MRTTLICLSAWYFSAAMPQLTNWPEYSPSQVTVWADYHHLLKEKHSYLMPLSLYDHLNLMAQQEKKACIESKLAADNFRRQTIRILVCNIEIGQ